MTIFRLAASGLLARPGPFSAGMFRLVVSARSPPGLKLSCSMLVRFRTVCERARPREAALEFLWRRSLLDDQDLDRMLKPPDGLARGQVDVVGRSRKV